MTWSSTWTLLTSADPFNDGNDMGSLPTGDIVWLGGDLVAVMCFSDDSGIIRIWAVDVADGDNPVVGPVAYFNVLADYVDWMADPPAADPKGQSMFPATMMIALSGNRFAIIGEGADSYFSDGSRDPDYDASFVHLASVFEVDPDTKVVSRISFAVVDYTLYNWVDATNACIWGDKLVLASSRVPSWVAIVDPAFADGNVVVYQPTTTLEQFVAPVVIGDQVIFMTYDFSVTFEGLHHIASIDLNTGDLTEGETFTGGGNFNEYSYYGTALGNGKAGYILSLATTGFNQGDLDIAHIATDLLEDTPVEVATGARQHGPFSGWASNVLSISATTGGASLVGWADTSGRFWVNQVTSSKGVASPEQVPIPNPSSGNNVHVARVVSTGAGRMAALFIRQTTTEGPDSAGYTYGANIILTGGVAEPVEPSVKILATRRFWG